jgi:hypothetical protein
VGASAGARSSRFTVNRSPFTKDKAWSDAMQTEDLRLDGNAAGGVLRELFAQEMTAALGSCAGCGTTGAIGALLEYGHGMGTILRCPRCDAPLLRIVRAAGQLRVDLSGILFLAIPESGAVA